MPRISKKNKAELLLALYNSDSDDDDDLLQENVHLRPSQISSPDSSLESSSPLPPSASIEMPVPAETKEKFEERAKRLAFDKAHLFHVEKIDHPSLLGWAVQKKKNSQGKISGYLPCGVRANPDERMDIGLKFDLHHELIRYVGVHYKDSGLLERVSKHNLVPYYGGPEEENNDHSTWSPKLMRMHLDFLRTKPEFQENTELKLRVEELALQYMLNEVLASYDRKTCLEAAAASKAAETENLPPQLSPAQWKSPTKAGSPKPTPQHIPFAAALEERPKQKLRAGDFIHYFHPVMEREKCEGVIVTVNPPRSKSHNIALEMQDSTLLPPTCHVKLVLRRLNKKLQEPRDKRLFFEEISKFQLDPSQNGKIQLVTKNYQLGQAYREMQNDLKESENDYWRKNAKQKDATENVEDEDDVDDTASEFEPSTPERSSKPAAATTPVTKLPQQSQESVVSRTKSTVPFASRRSPKRPPKPVKSVWRAQLETLLACTRDRRKERRHDPKLVNAKEAALIVAIQARQHLELLSGQKEGNQTVKELVTDLVDVFSLDKVRLWYFLDGDERNLIQVDNLIQDTKKWEDWLNAQCAAETAKQQQVMAPVTAAGDVAGQRAAPLENSALAKTLSMERVEKARDGDSDKLLSTAGVNTQPPSEATESASLMDAYGDKTSGGTRASNSVATGEEPIQGAKASIDASEPSAQQESASSGTKTGDNSTIGEEPIEGATPSIDGLESSGQQESVPGGTRAGDHVTTSEEPIGDATASIDVLEPSAQHKSASGGTRTNKQVPPNHTYLVVIKRVQEMASNAKRKFEQLEIVLAIWGSLERECRRSGTDVDDLVSTLAARIQKSEDSLRTFLHGNPNDSMSTDELEEFDALCQEYITNMTDDVPFSREPMPSSPKKKQRLD